MDDELEGLDGSETGPDAAADAGVAPGPEPVAQPAPRNPRQVRARRRRRRRQFGTLLFVVAAAGILAAAYFSLAGGDGSSEDATGTTGGGVTTTTAPPFSVNYKVITGVNVRPTPGTSAPSEAVVEQGHDVIVLCVVEGESVTAASGTTTTQWLKVAGLFPIGYVSAAYVSVGEDLRTQKIPACPAA
ncbi:MAG TPA: hypothetical protein VGN51_07325 [Acidimicrobiia bacterium]